LAGEKKYGLLSQQGEGDLVVKHNKGDRPVDYWISMQAGQTTWLVTGF